MVEEREAALFDLFPFSNKNKLAMLKICNALLRRLSKSHNTGGWVHSSWVVFVFGSSKSQHGWVHPSWFVVYVFVWVFFPPSPPANTPDGRSRARELTDRASPPPPTTTTTTTTATAICGRLMMYLSRNWDLSEPSALNKTGQANVANQTVYEDGEEFERQQVGGVLGRKVGREKD